MAVVVRRESQDDRAIIRQVNHLAFVRDGESRLLD
jgi:hypothetical protein